MNIVQSILQHYSEPSTDDVPTTSTLSNTLLPLGPGTFTHNQAGIPIIVVCTKADLIDEGRDPVTGGTTSMGLVKGKGSEWEEQTDTVMQILRVICLKCSFFYLNLGYITKFDEQTGHLFSTLRLHQRHCITSANTPFTFCSLLRLHPQRLLQGQRYQLHTGIHSPFLRSLIFSTGIAFSSPQVGIAGERLPFYEMGLTRRRGVKHGIRISRMIAVPALNGCTLN